MKKILFSLITLSSLALAFDMGAIADSVDGQKATDSVDKEKRWRPYQKAEISK